LPSSLLRPSAVTLLISQRHTLCSRQYPTGHQRCLFNARVVEGSARTPIPIGVGRRPGTGHEVTGSPLWLVSARYETRRPCRSRLRRATLTCPGQGEVSQRLPRPLLLPLPPRHRAVRQDPAGLQIPAHHPVQRRQRGHLAPALLQMPVQHRHVPARLRQHLPRLVGQLQPGPRPALHTALRPRRLQPTPHRAHIHPADLGARPHVGRRQRPGCIELQQPRHQHRPGHSQPRRNLIPRAPLPHRLTFRRGQHHSPRCSRAATERSEVPFP
jgi:hypothetical protein